MIKQADEMITCPITKGDACYVTEIQPGLKNYFSFSCGFWTNSLMDGESDFYNEQLELLPELYKELLWKDPETNLTWLPTTINHPQNGMVFANGPSALDWKWAAVKAIPVTKEERKKYPIPGKKGKYYDFRMDMTTMTSFEMDKFIDALDFIGVLS